MENFATLILAASLPFVAKTSVILLGLNGYLMQSFYKILQLCIPAVWRHKQGQKGINVIWPFDEPFPNRQTWLVATLIAVVLSVVAIAAINILAPMFEISSEAIRTGMDERFSIGTQGAVVIVIFLSFINSAIEELHFRAWLDREVSKRIGSSAGILISAIAFGGMHGLIFYGMPSVTSVIIFIIVVALAISGICWSLLARMRGGIHAAWWSHGLTDAMLLLWGLRWLGYV